MRTQDEIKSKIKEYYNLQSEEYASRYDMLKYNGAISALLWVLGNDVEIDNKGVAGIIESFNDQFEQLTLFDLKGDMSDESN